MRLDFFRGLALLIIVYDHVFTTVRVPGFAAVFEITPVYWGLASAMSVFVLISGLAYGQVYGPHFDRSGLGVTATRSLRRVFQIYLANIAIGLVTWFLLKFLLSAGLPSNDFFTQMATEEQTFGKLGVFVAMVQLRSDVWGGGILPLYMALIAVGPLVLWGLSRRPVVTLAVSALLFIGAQFEQIFPWTQAGFPRSPFHPLAWQILFVLGVAIHRIPITIPVRRSLAIAGAAALGVAWCSVWLIPKLVRHGITPELDWLALPNASHDVPSYTPVRFLYFLILAYVVRAVLPTDRRFWTAGVVAKVSTMGRHSLLVFSVGVVGSGVAMIVNLAYGAGWPVFLGEIIAIFALSYGVADLADRRKRVQSTAAAPVLQGNSYSIGSAQRRAGSTGHPARGLIRSMHEPFSVQHSRPESIRRRAPSP